MPIAVQDTPGNQFHFSSITEMVEVRAQETPNFPIIAVPDKHFKFHQYSYRDIDDGANRLAHYYAWLGVKPRTRGDATSSIVTALLAPSSIDYAINELAFAKMGESRVVVPNRLNLTDGTQGTRRSSFRLTTRSRLSRICSRLLAHQPSSYTRHSPRTARTQSHPTSPVKWSKLRRSRRGIIQSPSRLSPGR